MNDYCGSVNNKKLLGWVYETAGLCNPKNTHCSSNKNRVKLIVYL